MASSLVTFGGQAASLVLGLIVVVAAGDHIASSTDLLWGCGAGVASGVALVTFYRALSRGAMTVVAPITAVCSAMLPMAFGLARGERPGGVAYAGMVMAVAAVILVSGAVGVSHAATDSSTVLLAVVAGAGFAFIFIALEQTSGASGYWPLISSRVTSLSLMFIAMRFGPGFIRQRFSGIRPIATSVLLLTLGSGLLDMSANVLYLLAVRRGLLSVVVVVVALYPVSTVCLAFGIDKERVSRSQALGMGLAAAALVLVSLAGAE